MGNSVSSATGISQHQCSTTAAGPLPGRALCTQEDPGLREVWGLLWACLFPEHQSHLYSLRWLTRSNRTHLHCWVSVATEDLEVGVQVRTVLTSSTAACRSTGQSHRLRGWEACSRKWLSVPRPQRLQGETQAQAENTVASEEKRNEITRCFSFHRRKAGGNGAM